MIEEYGVPSDLRLRAIGPAPTMRQEAELRHERCDGKCPVCGRRCVFSLLHRWWDEEHYCGGDRGIADHRRKHETKARRRRRR